MFKRMRIEDIAKSVFVCIVLASALVFGANQLLAQRAVAQTGPRTALDSVKLEINTKYPCNKRGQSGNPVFLSNLNTSTQILATYLVDDGVSVPNSYRVTLYAGHQFLPIGCSKSGASNLTYSVLGAVYDVPSK
jgi:hypothetical protein